VATFAAERKIVAADRTGGRGDFGEEESDDLGSGRRIYGRAEPDEALEFLSVCYARAKRPCGCWERLAWMYGN